MSNHLSREYDIKPRHAPTGLARSRSLDVMDDVDRIARAGLGGLRIAAAESLTSGLLCSRVGAADQASEWFAGGVVAYSTEVKQRLLGVPEGTDPCSAACAEQLAIGARDLLGAHIAISTTGVGGPEPTDGHPAGTVFLGWASPTESGHHFLQLDGDPAEVLAGTVAALRLLADRCEHEAHRRAESSIPRQR